MSLGDPVSLRGTTARGDPRRVKAIAALIIPFDSGAPGALITGSVEAELLDVGFHCGIVTAKNQIEGVIRSALLNGKTLNACSFQQKLRI